MRQYVSQAPQEPTPGGSGGGGGIDDTFPTPREPGISTSGSTRDWSPPDSRKRFGQCCKPWQTTALGRAKSLQESSRGSNRHRCTTSAAMDQPVRRTSQFQEKRDVKSGCREIHTANTRVSCVRFARTRVGEKLRAYWRNSVSQSSVLVHKNSRKKHNMNELGAHNVPSRAVGKRGVQRWWVCNQPNDE